MNHKAEKIIDHFRNILICPVAVTGSLALAEFGLCKPEVFTKDIDLIIVNPTESDISTLETLSKIIPANNITREFRRKHLMVSYQLRIEDVTIDIFQEEHKESDPPFFNKGGRLFNSPDRIIAVKKRMGRMKDWVQIRDIALGIMRGSHHVIDAMLEMGSVKVGSVDHTTGELLPRDQSVSGGDYAYVNIDKVKE